MVSIVFGEFRSEQKPQKHTKTTKKNKTQTTIDFWVPNFRGIPLPETHIFAPEKWWLESRRSGFLLGFGNS